MITFCRSMASMVSARSAFAIFLAFSCEKRRVIAETRPRQETPIGTLTTCVRLKSDIQNPFSQRMNARAVALIRSNRSILRGIPTNWDLLRW